MKLASLGCDWTDGLQDVRRTLAIENDRRRRRVESHRSVEMAGRRTAQSIRAGRQVSFPCSTTARRRLDTDEAARLIGLPALLDLLPAVYQSRSTVSSLLPAFQTVTDSRPRPLSSLDMYVRRRGSFWSRLLQEMVKQGSY